MPTPPTPPATLSSTTIEALNSCSREELHDAVRYAESLLEHEQRLDSDTDTDDEAEPDRDEDLPEDVPSKATITIKAINDNRYYYYQWRDGERIKSKYKGPVDSDE
jgi:hypothetical protein